MPMLAATNKVFEFCNIYEFMSWLDTYFLKSNLRKHFTNKTKLLISCNEMSSLL